MSATTPEKDVGRNGIASIGGARVLDHHPIHTCFIGESL